MKPGPQEQKFLAWFDNEVREAGCIDTKIMLTGAAGTLPEEVFEDLNDMLAAPSNPRPLAFERR